MYIRISNKYDYCTFKTIMIVETYVYMRNMCASCERGLEVEKLRLHQMKNMLLGHICMSGGELDRLLCITHQIHFDIEI